MGVNARFRKQCRPGGARRGEPGTEGGELLIGGPGRSQGWAQRDQPRVKATFGQPDLVGSLTECLGLSNPRKRDARGFTGCRYSMPIEFPFGGVDQRVRSQNIFERREFAAGS
jgi:hypothetical protein